MQINDVVRIAGGELARPALFNTFLSIPSVVYTNKSVKDYDVLCKSVNIPPVTNEPIMMKYLGQSVPISGRVNTSNRLQVTFMLDEYQEFYKELVTWAKGMDINHYNTTSKIQNIQKSYIADKLGEITITPYTWVNNTDISYIFSGIYPINVSGINLQSDNTSSTMEIVVEFSFLTFDVIGLDTGSVVESIEGDLINFTYELINGLASPTNTSKPTVSNFGLTGFSNFTDNIPQYAAQTIAKEITNIFKF
jgi:hypothetical protein